LLREGKQKAKALRCVMVAPVLRVNRIADVACVSLDVRRRPDSQTNDSEFLAGGGVNHPELVGRHPVDRLDSVLDQLELNLMVAKTGYGRKHRY
jgi:hypothetical protein